MQQFCRKELSCSNSMVANMKSLCAAVAAGITAALSAAVEFSAFENPAKEHRQSAVVAK